MHLSKLYFRRLDALIILGLLLVSFFAAAIVIKPVVGQGSWWSSSWLYRKTLTINHTKVAGSLTNFPVLINLTDTDLSVKAQSDGDDIVFTDSSDNKLNHEIELYNSTTGHLVAWTRANLSSTADTVLYMYYGNPAATDQQNAAGVWDSNFMMVQHLEETSGTEYDSTSNNNDGTPYGALNQNAVGQMDGADAFDGTNDYIDTMADDALSTAFTLSLWIKTAGLASWNHIISSYNVSGFMIANNQGQNRPWLYMSAKNVLFSPGIYNNVWHYLVGTFDGSNITSYTDGSFNQSVATSFSNGPVSIKIGCQGVPNPLYYYSGSLDEVRVSKVARSADWIATEYNNQYSPSTFYTVGAEEEPPAPLVSASSPTNGAVGVSIDLSELSFNLSDAQGDLMDYWVTTTPNIGSGSGTDASNGRYSISVSGLACNIIYTWCVNVTDGVDWTNKTFTLTTEPTATWWNSDWLCRKMILIDHTKVSASLTDFPVLVGITDLDLKNWAQSDGDDIVFTDSSDNRLDHEIELYESGSGHLVAWIKIPDLSSITDTVLYMYYGNAAASSQQNPEGVWDSSFMMVQHLGEASGTVYDSTSNNNDGTAYGGLNQNAVGQMDGADLFDGTNDYIDTGMNGTVLSSAFTVSLWIKTTGLAYWNHTISNYVSSPASGFMIADNHDQSRPWLYMSAKSVLFSPGIYNNVWHYLVGTFDGSNITSYTDGSFNQSNVTSFSNSSVSIKIGCQGTPNYYYGGSLDEVRVSKVARSAAWITTEYNNQHDPSTFYTVGAEKVALAPVALDPYPAEGAISVPLSLSELSFNLTDAQGDLMDYWVTTSPDIGSGNGADVTNGRYSVPVSGLAYGTTYIWFINVTDGVYWNNKTLTFTSVYEEPLVYDEDPADGAVGVRLNPLLQAGVFDAQGDSVDWFIRANASGTWATVNSGTLPTGSGTVSALPSTMNQLNTAYYWMVCAIDPYGSGKWTNETYMFTTKATWQIIHKWSASVPSTAQREAIGADVNGDSVKEVIQPYSGGMRALSGSNGNTVWTYSDGSVDGESVVLACDLTMDGVPEILVTIPGGLLALYANGSLYWKITGLSGSGHSYGPIAFDLDGDGYPTIFAATKLDGTLYALSHDGQILYSNADINKPCWGQISLMDYDSDGHFELYLTDLKYVKSFWAENLTLRWSRSIEIGAAHCVEAAAPQLIDVDGDGVRDVVATICDYYDEANYTCGVAILDASDGSIVRVQTGTDMQGVLTPSIYDVDGDGNLELIGQCEYSYHHGLMVWDLDNWSMDRLVELTTSSTWQPRVADVTGDGKMEIIAIDGSLLRIFNSTYDEIAQITISGSALVYPLVEDFDGDGLNELLVTSASGVHVYDTDGAYPLGGMRSDVMYYSEYRLGTAEYTPPPTTTLISNEQPINGSTSVPLNPTLSATVSHFGPTICQSGLMNITFMTNATGTWQVLRTYTCVGNGIYDATTTNMNNYSTTYCWMINANDGYHLSSTVYYFTTTPGRPGLQLSPISVICRKYCENFTTTMNVTEAYKIEDFEFEIHYNTTLLDYVSVTWVAWGTGSIAVDEVNGIIVGHTYGTPLTGNLTLVTLDFHAAYYHIWKDESQVLGWKNDLNGTIYFQWANLSYPSSPDLRYERDGLNEIEVGPDVIYTFSPIQGDVNNDGDVDIFDLRTTAAYYNAKEGDSNWSQASEYDLNGDKVIDIFDLVAIAVKYGFAYDP